MRVFGRGVLLLSVCTGLASADRSGTGITADDISASFDRIAARYRHRAAKASTNTAVADFGAQLLQSAAVQQTLDVEAADSVSAHPLPAVFNRKRGLIVPLTPVGGYPVMLGTTYNAQIGIGTPAQPFRLTADTGSILTWAIRSDCALDICPDGSQRRKAKYDPKASTTARLDKSAGNDHEAYGDGEADFALYHDTVAFLPSAQSATMPARNRRHQLAVYSATVGGAIKTFASDAKLDHDGLLGLGRQAKSTEPKTVSPVLSNLHAEPLVLALEFTENSAQMEVGGLDAAHYPNISYFKVPADDDGWTLSNVMLQADVQTSSMHMLMDSGSSVVIVPQAVLDQIMSTPGLGASTSARHVEPTIYSLPCTAKLGLRFRLSDGKVLELADETLLMKSNDASLPGDCLSMIVGTTNPFLPSVAGIPLLKNFYTVLASNVPSAQGARSADWIGVAPIKAYK